MKNIKILLATLTLAMIFLGLQAQNSSMLVEKIDDRFDYL